jgi:hypothetical protein
MSFDSEFKVYDSQKEALRVLIGLRWGVLLGEGYRASRAVGISPLNEAVERANQALGRMWEGAGPANELVNKTHVTI